MNEKKKKAQRDSTKGKINYKVGYLAIWFAVLSTYTFQDRGSCKETILTDFPSMLGLSPFFLQTKAQQTQLLNRRGPDPL